MVQGARDERVPLSSFLGAMSRLLNRDPYVFMDVLARTCTVSSTSPAAPPHISLRKPTDPPPPAQGQHGAAAAATGGAGTQRPAGGSRRGSRDGGASGMDLTPAPSGSTAAAAAQLAEAAGAAAAVADAPAAPGTTVPKTPAPPGTRHVTRKSVPASFVDVIDSLVDVIMSYKGSSRTAQQDAASGAAPAGNSASAQPESMELDAAGGSAQGAAASTTAAAVAGGAAGAPASAAGAAAAGTAPGSGAAAAPTQQQLKQQQEVESTLQQLLHNSPEVMQRLSLRFLTEFSLLFSATVGLLLKRDEQLAIGALGSSAAAAAAAAADAVSPVAPATEVKGGGKGDTQAARDKDAVATPASGLRRGASGNVMGGTAGKGARGGDTASKRHASGHDKDSKEKDKEKDVHDKDGRDKDGKEKEKTGQGHGHGHGQHRAGALLRQLIHVHLVADDGAASFPLGDKVNELLQVGGAVCGGCESYGRTGARQVKTGGDATRAPHEYDVTTASAQYLPAVEPMSCRITRAFPPCVPAGDLRALGGGPPPHHLGAGHHAAGGAAAAGRPGPGAPRPDPAQRAGGIRCGSYSSGGGRGRCRRRCGRASGSIHEEAWLPSTYNGGSQPQTDALLSRHGQCLVLRL